MRDKIANAIRRHNESETDWDEMLDELCDLHNVIWRCSNDLKYDCDSGNCFTKGNLYEQVDVNNKQGLIILRSNYNQDTIISGTDWKKEFIAI